MVYYKPVKITINTIGQAKVIINTIMRHHYISDFIVSNWESVFTLNFRLLLCYFFGIKRRLSTAFYLQINSETEWQNSTMKAYLRAYVQFEQDDWV